MPAMPYEDMKIPFGKHKGELIADLTDSYLDWLLDQDWFAEKFPKHVVMVKKEIGYRKKFNIVMIK